MCLPRTQRPGFDKIGDGKEEGDVRIWEMKDAVEADRTQEGSPCELPRSGAAMVATTVRGNQSLELLLRAKGNTQLR